MSVLCLMKILILIFLHKSAVSIKTYFKLASIQDFIIYFFALDFSDRAVLGLSGVAEEVVFLIFIATVLLLFLVVFLSAISRSFFTLLISSCQIKCNL